MKETKILTHLFYFMPQSITFRSKAEFISALEEETRQNIYSAFEIKKISDTFVFKEFLKSMKKHISVKDNKNGYTITKNASFKVIAEADINTWGSQYKNLLTKLSKRLIVWTTSYREHVEEEKINEYQKIRIVAGFYKNVDEQVREWLFELAKMKEIK
jgi:hypothetical protein